MPTAAAPVSPAEVDRVLAHAVRAPSVLNSQPWRFVVDGDTVRLYADRDRQLHALDPDGRELTLSCGAALLYLRIAARHEGLGATVHPLPDGADPDLLAEVTLQPGFRPPGDDRLFRALALRRTNRHPFADHAVPFGVAAEMAGAASFEGAALAVFDTDTDKEALARLVEAGVMAQSQDTAVLDDLRAWLRPRQDPRPDGVRDEAQGVWDRHAAMRTPPESVAAYKGRLVREAPAVLVLSTVHDGPADWLAAGQALARALVVAADRGLAASYANEPVEVDALRGELAALVGSGHPQAVFRVGYPEAEPSTARRSARDVVDRA